MKRFWIGAIGLALAVVSSASMAFEEQKLPQSQAGSASQPSAAPAGVPGMGLSDGGVQVPRIDGGTKIRVPGLGVIGEIPKMDFGLELLYGASQPKGSDVDRSEANGVMGRVTVPLKSPR